MFISSLGFARNYSHVNRGPQCSIRPLHSGHFVGGVTLEPGWKNRQGPAKYVYKCFKKYQVKGCGVKAWISNIYYELCQEGMMRNPALQSRINALKCCGQPEYLCCGTV